MERLTVTDVEERYEALLRKAENDNFLKVTNAETLAVKSLGYTSAATRVKVTGRSGDGTEFTKFFFVKQSCDNPMLCKIMRLADFFHNEMHFYTTLKPLLGDFGPECIYADGREIIMEDVGKLGYVARDRADMLEYNHCLAALKELASFHAASLSLKLKDTQKFLDLTEPLREGTFPTDEEWSVGKLMEYGLHFAINLLKDDLKKVVVFDRPSKETKMALDCLLVFKDKVFHIMSRMVARRYEKYHVLIHGDSWKNNYLFKPAIGGSFLVKLVDYQLIRHSSVAIDIMHLIYSSASDFVLENRVDDLIQEYHNHFILNLKQRGVSHRELRILSIDWLRRELQNHAFYGLIISFMTVHACYAAEEEEAFPEMELNSKVFEEFMKNMKPHPMKSARVRQVIKHFMGAFTKNGAWTTDVNLNIRK